MPASPPALESVVEEGLESVAELGGGRGEDGVWAPPPASSNATGCAAPAGGASTTPALSVASAAARTCGGEGGGRAEPLRGRVAVQRGEWRGIERTAHTFSALLWRCVPARTHGFAGATDCAAEKTAMCPACHVIITAEKMDDMTSFIRASLSRPFEPHSEDARSRRREMRAVRTARTTRAARTVRATNGARVGTGF